MYKKQKNNSWKDITSPVKKGNKVPYTFFEVCLNIEMKIEVYEIRNDILTKKQISKKKIGDYIVIPTNNKTPKINKVVLLNRGAKDINKASYQDTLTAQAHCVGLFNQEIEFSLWEDDAKGNGHNANVNKNNKAPRIYKSTVNKNGIAEVKISLAADERILRQIANKYMMQGDTSEGANHEYYVTASYNGSIKGASQVNVNVQNPDAGNKSLAKPKAPSPNTPQYPATSGSSAPAKSDPEGNIRDAFFVNDKGEKLSKIKVGEHVKVRIFSKNMIGKRIQYVIWEYDTVSNDEVYRSAVMKIIADSVDTGGFVISQHVFDKGSDIAGLDSDNNNQNYFIEIISFDTKNTSNKFGVTSDGLMKVESAKSPSAVEPQQNLKHLLVGNVQIVINQLL